MEKKELELKSEIEFNPDNLSHIFKNINHKPCDAIGFDYAWNVTSNERFIGELFYSNEFREWHFIKDNFPSPRRLFRTSFPMDKNRFIDMFKSIRIELQIAE